MKIITVVAALLFWGACTVNIYDYSSHSGGGSQPPDTVFIESGPESAPLPPPFVPDTVFWEYDLIGEGHVEIEQCGNWSRYTLIGCVAETDGVAFEARPVMISVVSSDGAVAREYQIEFACRIQSYLVDSDGESSAVGSSTSLSSADRTALPAVTGTELVTIVANRTSFPFLVEQAVSYDGNWLADGTLVYDAVFSSSEWMIRDICTAGQLVVSSESPDYRMLFGDSERRLLQQFFDIFVIHDGEPPVLPVGSAERAVRN